MPLCCGFVHVMRNNILAEIYTNTIYLSIQTVAIWLPSILLRATEDHDCFIGVH